MTPNADYDYIQITGWMGIEDATDGHVVVLTQDVFDVIHGEPFPVYRRIPLPPNGRSETP